MAKLTEWLSKRKFEVYLAAFCLMMLLPIGLDITARRGADMLIFLLIGGYVLTNLAVVLTHE